MQAPLGSEYVDERDKEFKELVDNLKIVLKEKSRSGKVWIRPEDKKDFKILLVDKVGLFALQNLMLYIGLTPRMSDYHYAR